MACPGQEFLVNELGSTPELGHGGLQPLVTQGLLGPVALRGREPRFLFVLPCGTSDGFELAAKLITSDQPGLKAQQTRGHGFAKVAELEALAHVRVTVYEFREISAETLVELPYHRPELSGDLPEFTDHETLSVRHQALVEAGIREKGIPERDVRLLNELGKYGALWFPDEHHGGNATSCSLDQLRRSMQVMSKPDWRVLGKLKRVDGERGRRPCESIDHQFRAGTDNLDIVPGVSAAGEGKISERMPGDIGTQAVPGMAVW